MKPTCRKGTLEAKLTGERTRIEKNEDGYWFCVGTHMMGCYRTLAEAQEHEKLYNEHAVKYGFPASECACKGAREESVLTGGFVETEKLSDGSIVFDVHIPDQTINCRDEKAAEVLIDRIAAAIKEAQ